MAMQIEEWKARIEKAENLLAERKFLLEFVKHAEKERIMEIIFCRQLGRSDAPSASFDRGELPGMLDMAIQVVKKRIDEIQSQLARLDVRP